MSNTLRTLFRSKTYRFLVLGCIITALYLHFSSYIPASNKLSDLGLRPPEISVGSLTNIISGAPDPEADITQGEEGEEHEENEGVDEETLDSDSSLESAEFPATEHSSQSTSQTLVNVISTTSVTSVATSEYPQNTDTIEISTASDVEPSKPTVSMPALDTATHPGLQDLPCSTLEGGDKILIVIKTGATEVLEKLPPHLKSTLRCVPHYELYSDLDEIVEGIHVHDSLEEVPEDIKNSHEDFEYYRELRQMKMEGKDYHHLKAKGDKEDNKGWILDKWKNLPLMSKAWARKNDANWYVFIDADTYLVWLNLLQWLAKLDPTKSYYMGSPAWINDMPFAHGGSGYVLSNAALKAAVELIDSNKAHYYGLATDECCGDYIVGRLFKEELDHEVQGAWPNIQGETLGSLDYSAENWCHPVISYHHVSPQDIVDMWRFEQNWINKTANPQPILHRDAFDYMVLPFIKKEVMSWDNVCLDESYTARRVKANPDMKPEEKVAHTSMASCRALCESNERCLQYSYQPGPVECRLGYVIRPGRKLMGTNSGWMVRRIEAFQREMEAGQCKPVWAIPDKR